MENKVTQAPSNSSENERVVLYGPDNKPAVVEKGQERREQPLVVINIVRELGTLRDGVQSLDRALADSTLPPAEKDNLEGSRKKAKATYEATRDRAQAESKPENESAVEEGLDPRVIRTAKQQEIKEKLSLDPEPYSGKFIRGSLVNFDGQTGWEVLGYDTQTGHAMLKRINDGTTDMRVIDQETLYRQNQNPNKLTKTPQEKGPNEPTNEPTKDPFKKAEVAAPETPIETTNKPAETTLPEAIPADTLKLGEAAMPETAKPEARAEAIESAASKLEEGYTLDEIEEGLRYGRETGRPGEVAYWEDEKRMYEERLRALEKAEKAEPVGPTWRERIVSTFSKAKEKARSAWGWMKDRARRSWNFLNRPITKADMKKAGEAVIERGLGLATFGIWDIHQAEKLRGNTKSIGKEAGVLEGKIQEEKHLSEAEAWAEAEHMQRAFAASGVEGEMLKEDYEVLSEAITRRKVEQNNKVTKEIIDGVMMSLQVTLDNNSLVRSYRTAGGQKVLTPEKLAALRTDLEAQLGRMRDGQDRKDVVNYAALMRRNLDPNWWKRYIYGGLEAIGGAVGVRYLADAYSAKQLAAMKAMVGDKAAPLVAPEITPTIPNDVIPAGPEAIPTPGIYSMQPGDNIWNLAEKFRAAQGLSTDNTSLLEVVKQYAAKHGIAVQDWGQSLDAVRTMLDTKMPVGTQVNIADLLK